MFRTRQLDSEGDVSAWLAKIKLVAKHHGINDLLSFISLYLDGLALTLYFEMKEKDQLSTEEIKICLMKVFTEGPITAHG